MDSNTLKEYTLVLDLDETLVHYEEDKQSGESRLYIRPFCHEFLAHVAELYEVVIFTAAM
jgi:CTD small phosphatase-like protein 2